MAGAYLPILSASNDTNESITSGSWKVMVSIPGSSFVSGHKYALFACGTLIQSGGSNSELVRIQHVLPDGTTDPANRHDNFSGNIRSAKSDSFMFVRTATANGSSDYYLYATADGTTAEIAYPRLLAIDLDAYPDLFPSSEWDSGWTSGMSSYYSSYTNVQSASLDFGNDGGGNPVNDWLVIGTCLNSNLSGTLSGEMSQVRLAHNDGVGGYTNLVEARQFVDDYQPDDLHICLPVMALVGPTYESTYGIGSVLTAGTNIISLQTMSTDSDLRYRASSLFAIKLNGFKDPSSSQDTWKSALFIDTSPSDSVGTSGISVSSGNSKVSGTTRAERGYSWDTSNHPRVNFGYASIAAAGGGNQGFTHHLWNSTTLEMRGPDSTGEYINDQFYNTLIPVPMFHVEDTNDNGTVSMNWRAGGDSGNRWAQQLFVSFYPFLPGALEQKTTSLGAVIAETKQLLADLAVLKAGTFQSSADMSLAVAEIKSRVTSLGFVIAETFDVISDMEVAVADTIDLSAILDISLEGSVRKEVLLRVLVAAVNEVSASCDVTLAETYGITSFLNLTISDKAHIIIEPDRPKVLPIVSVDDLETS